MATLTKKDKRIRRHSHIRKNIIGIGACPRLSIFRSSKHIYAQLIDDIAGKTLSSSSTLEKDVSQKVAGKNKSEIAGLVGKAIAEKALKKGIKKIVFDRGGFKYHGRIKALADASREAGLKF